MAGTVNLSLCSGIGVVGVLRLSSKRSRVAGHQSAGGYGRSERASPGKGKWQLQCRNSAGDEQAQAQAQTQAAASAAKFDVSSNCVTPVFRVSPYFDDGTAERSGRMGVLFLSEGNVCRSVYADAVFAALIDKEGLNDSVDCSSKATRDYNAGEAPDERAVEVAKEAGLTLRQAGGAQVFTCPEDLVRWDLLVVMDKFNASDVMKEVTVYETINKQDRFSYKVRRLGEFCRTRVIDDIDDPLYGNMGGPEEVELLHQALKDIQESCAGLLNFILQVRQTLQGSETLREGVARQLKQMEALDWLVPPMLSSKS